MEIVDGNKDDLNDISLLEASLFSDPYTSKDLIDMYLNNPFLKILVYKNNGEIIGYLLFAITFTNATIYKIGVKKDYQNRGIGTKLIKRSEEILKENNVEFYTLEVRKSNVNAISFYEKLGFIYITSKKEYYSNGEDALYLMKGEIDG